MFKNLYYVFNVNIWFFCSYSCRQVSKTKFWKPFYSGRNGRNFSFWQLERCKWTHILYRPQFRPKRCSGQNLGAEIWCSLTFSPLILKLILFVALSNSHIVSLSVGVGFWSSCFKAWRLKLAGAGAGPSKTWRLKLAGAVSVIGNSWLTL